MSADRNVSDKAYDEAIRRSFRSIASELEKVTSERDELLKGYRAIRVCLKDIGEFKGNMHHCRECYSDAADYIAEQARNLLTSFPEIK